MKEVCNAEWDDIQDRLKEKAAEIDAMAKLCMLLKQDLADKDAEIERLLTEHGEMSDSRREWMESCIATRGEIERLKGQIDVRDAVISKLSGMVAEWRPLLTRAAEMLETLGCKGPAVAELRQTAE